MDLPLAWLVTFRHVFFGNVFSRHYPSGENVEREREKERERGFEGRVQGCFVIEDRLHNKRAKKKITKYQCVSKFIDSATKMT